MCCQHPQPNSFCAKAVEVVPGTSEDSLDDSFTGHLFKEIFAGVWRQTLCQRPLCLQGMSVQSIVLAWCQFSQSFHRGKSNPTACKITVTTAKYESSQALKSASTLENLELSQPYRRVQRPDVVADTFNSSVWESQEALSKCEAILVYLVSSRKTEP